MDSKGFELFQSFGQGRDLDGYGRPAGGCTAGKKETASGEVATTRRRFQLSTKKRGPEYARPIPRPFLAPASSVQNIAGRVCLVKRFCCMNPGGCATATALLPL